MGTSRIKIQAIFKRTNECGDRIKNVIMRLDDGSVHVRMLALVKDGNEKGWEANSHLIYERFGYKLYYRFFGVSKEIYGAIQSVMNSPLPLEEDKMFRGNITLKSVVKQDECAGCKHYLGTMEESRLYCKYCLAGSDNTCVVR